MKFLLSISTKKKTFIAGRFGKDYNKLLVMMTSIFAELLKVINKEDILICLEIAENHNKKKENKEMGDE